MFDNGSSLGLNVFSVRFLEELVSNNRQAFIPDVRNQIWEMISNLMCSDGESGAR